MANIVGLMSHCRKKGDAAIIGHLSHINNWERGNIASLGHIMPQTVQNQPDGTMDLDEIDFFCRDADPHLTTTRAIALETTHNDCGGRVLTMDYIKKVKKLAKKNKMKMHLDGARCLNAAVSLGITPAEMVKDFDTVSVCLSKGLGCPIGSVLAGPEKDLKHFYVLRKLLGGNLRQAGILTKAALVNLEDWELKLAEDHRKAQWFAEELSKISCIDIDLSVIETNIFSYQFKPDF